MDRGPWQATIHGAAKGRTRLSDFHFSSAAGISTLIAKVRWRKTGFIYVYILFTETSLRWNIFLFALWPFAFQPLSKDHL